LWIVIVIRIFTSTTLFNVVIVVVITDALLMTIYFILTLRIGAKINSSGTKQISNLLREKLKITLEIHQLREEYKNKLTQTSIKEIENLEACKELIHILTEIIEQQHSSFQLLGFSISETASKMLLGLTVSTTVACIARIGLDLSRGEG